jgi:hypothetical protein
MGLIRSRQLSERWGNYEITTTDGNTAHRMGTPTTGRRRRRNLLFSFCVLTWAQRQLRRGWKRRPTGRTGARPVAKVWPATGSLGEIAPMNSIKQFIMVSPDFKLAPPAPNGRLSASPPGLRRAQRRQCQNVSRMGVAECAPIHHHPVGARRKTM